MQTYPWLTTLIFAPAIGGAFLWFTASITRRSARSIAVLWSLAELVGVLAMANKFDLEVGGVQFAERHEWIPSFGVSYAVGLNGIGLVMVVLSAVLVPVVLIAARGEQSSPAKESNYAVLVLFLESFMIAVFAARDVFFFYLLFEAMLIPVYFMIGSFGGRGRRRAATKFLLYSLAGGLIMLGGVIAVWTKGPGGPDGFMVDNLVGYDWGPGSTERLMFLSFFAAFAIKAPMFPVHSWLPDAAQAAKPGTSVLLVGVLDKVGTFGMVTLCLPLFPDAAKWATPVIATLAVISIWWGGLLALGQRDILRLVAYSSVSHFGFIVLGIFALTPTSEIGANFYMVNHGLSTGALFLLAGFLIQRRGSQDMFGIGRGLQRVTPLLAGTFLMVGLSTAALPGFSTFVSEFMVMAGAFERLPNWALLSTLGVVLAALYILGAYQRIFTGPVPEDLGPIIDLKLHELWAVGPLIGLMLWLGLSPAPAIDLLREPSKATVEVVEPDRPARAMADLAWPLDQAEAEGGAQ
ncbi:MAG: NADH-quinone oxidoreductase subunit M [Bifidobacteriaceae bacterium]|nr:NADH-quinone oxidoreductase subunit M [Bifidobacteriaceae bacterium]